MHKQNEIIRWATDRRIIQESNPITQSKKTVEEANEMLEAIESGDIEHFKLEAGDVYVTLVLVCEMAGVDLGDCINAAYDKIKSRKGMMIQGKYVKQSDLDKLEEAGLKITPEKIYAYVSNESLAEEVVELIVSMNLDPLCKFNNLFDKYEVSIR